MLSDFKQPKLGCHAFHRFRITPLSKNLGRKSDERTGMVIDVAI